MFRASDFHFEPTARTGSRFCCGKTNVTRENRPLERRFLLETIMFIQFHLAISGRGSLLMNRWMFHLFTPLDGQVQQEHKGRASRHTQTMPAPAGNTHARAWVERTSPQSKTRTSWRKHTVSKQPRAQGWQEISTPSQWNSLRNRDHFR